MASTAGDMVLFLAEANGFHGGVQRQWSRSNAITVRWTLAHQGVEGNDTADT